MGEKPSYYPDGENEHPKKEGLCGYCGSNDHDTSSCPKLHEKHGKEEEPIVTIYPKEKEADDSETAKAS